jgi:hypothetical protein
MNADTTHGILYRNPEALAKAKAREHAVIADIAAWSHAHHQQRINALAAQRQRWIDAGITERASVLLTPEASRALLPTCATRNGIVQLDAMLLEIHPDASAARCQMWFHDAPRTINLDLQLHQIDRPLGHPFTIWNRTYPERSALARSQRHDPHPNPHYQRPPYWET